MREFADAFYLQVTINQIAWKESTIRWKVRTLHSECPN